MATDQPAKASDEGELAAPPEAWWAGLGPVGGFLLTLCGLGLLLWAFLGLSGSHAPLIHQAAKLVAIGLVVTGTTLVARRRASSRRLGEETELRSFNGSSSGSGRRGRPRLRS